MSAAADALAQKMAQTTMSVEERVHVQQTTELEKMRQALSTLTAGSVQNLSNVQIANVSSAEELKNVLSNVEQQLHLEQTSRKLDSGWYKGVIEEMG